MKSQVVRFSLKLALFSIPVLAYLAATVGLGYWAGEFRPLRDVAAVQAGGEPVLYGRAYRDNFFAFKLIATMVRKPDVLVIGSSRSMQFRAGLLNRAPDRFYNAGGAAQRIEEISEFLNGLDSASLPKVLILGLDQPWFNQNTSQGFSPRRAGQQLDDEQRTGFERAMNAGRFILKDLANARIRPAALARHTDPFSGGYAIGISAIVRGWGFRNDGSFQYASSTYLRPQTSEQRLAESLARLTNGQDHLTSGDRIADSAMSALESVLQFCRDHSIEALGFSPPYAPAILDRMNEQGRHSYLQVYTGKVSALFEKYDFVFMDSLDPTTRGGSDDDMMDGFHGSEFLMASIYRTFLEQRPQVLGRYTDAAALDELIRNRKHPFLLFDADVSRLKKALLTQ